MAMDRATRNSISSLSFDADSEHADIDKSDHIVTVNDTARKALLQLGNIINNIVHKMMDSFAQLRYKFSTSSINANCPTSVRKSDSSLIHLERRIFEWVDEAMMDGNIKAC